MVDLLRFRAIPPRLVSKYRQFRKDLISRLVEDAGAKVSKKEELIICEGKEITYILIPLLGTSPNELLSYCKAAVIHKLHRETTKTFSPVKTKTIVIGREKIDNYILENYFKADSIKYIEIPKYDRKACEDIVWFIKHD